MNVPGTGNFLRCSLRSGTADPFSKSGAAAECTDQHLSCTAGSVNLTSHSQEYHFLCFTRHNHFSRMLCDACETLTIDRLYACAREYVPTSKSGWNQTGYLEFHASLESLETAAEGGCPNCRTFLERFIEVQCGVEELGKRIGHLAGSPGSPVPVIAFLQVGFKEDGKHPIQKLHLQIGTDPWKPGVNPLVITFKISQPRGSSMLFKYCSRADHSLQHIQKYATLENTSLDTLKSIVISDMIAISPSPRTGFEGAPGTTIT